MKRVVICPRKDCRHIQLWVPCKGCKECGEELERPADKPKKISKKWSYKAARTTYAASA